MNFRFEKLIFLLSLISLTELKAQAPINDNCETASEIIIGNKGFDFGTFISAKADVTYATRQKAETCVKELEETGNCSKTVWYKFYIPTTRNVSVKLTQQDSAIPQIFAGFNIYKIADCNYNLSSIASQLTPLNKFGVSGNNCLSAGWYLVQVGCKQKAKGEIWVELMSSGPSGLYDSYTNFYDFKTISNYASLSHKLECTSIDYEEYNQLKDSSLNKSIWICFSLKANATFNSLEIKGVYNNKCKYRIFNSNVTEDSLKSKKPFLDLNADGQIINEMCPNNAGSNKIYFMQIVFDDKITSIRIDIYNYLYRADDWNTPDKPNVANISSDKEYKFRHYFNCDGLLKNHKCKNIIPNYFLRKYKGYKNNVIQDFVDTFKIGAYTVLNVLEDGIINFRFNDNHRYDQYYHYSLYQEDITKNCNLTLLIDTFISSYSNFAYCIKKGVYTLVTSVDKIELSYYDQSIYLYLTKKSNIKYNNPKFPEKLGNFNPLSGNSIKSKSISYSNKDTTLIVETLKLKGKMNFHEVTISESGDFNMICYHGYFYIFSGSISKGKLKLLNGIDYSFQNRYVGNQTGIYCSDCSCFSLPKGDYTVILVYPYPKLECDPAFDSIYFKTNSVCPITSNNEPSKAFPINNNQDVFYEPAKQYLDYIYGLQVCSDCRNSNSGNAPKLSCRIQKNLTPNTTYSYYTFYTNENCELKLFTNNIPLNTYEIYEGNVLTNNSLLQDTSKIVSPCNNGNLICNLQGKKIYTLVLINPSVKGNYALFFVKHRVTKNDFATNAYDFGHLLDTKTVRSNYEPLTCHTNGFITDPIPPGKVYGGSSSNIKYKDSINFKRRYSERKNLWYTFTASGNSQIVISVLSSITVLNKPYINVYKYNGVFNTSFKQTLTSNFDSTIKSMEWVSGNNISAIWTDSFKFTNSSCGDNRYFVVLDEDKNATLSHEYALKIKSSLLKIVLPEGDFCSNATTGNYNKFGNNSIKTNTTCHTYGNSVFEETPDATIKSSWFKIKVTDLEKFDLQIRNSNNSQALLRYNIYGGNCKGMTKITNVADRYSYFTLSCMGSGEYYIQAISDNKMDVDLQFDVNIVKPENINCKPYEFKYPIAQFKITGGCQNVDSIKFINQSTKGGDITYQWYLNGNVFSNFVSPLLLRKNPALKDTNEIKLIVFNTSEFTRDTFILKYLKDARIYNFKIQGPLNSYCYDTVYLKINTDFPHKINYSWYQYREADPIISNTSFYTTRAYNYWYYVKGESDNCFFKDSFKLNVYQSLNKFNDSSICYGDKYLIKNSSLNNYYLYFENQTYKQILPNDSFAINIPGIFSIYYYEKGCSYNDTFKIKIEPGPKLLKYTDSLYYCNVPYVDLSYQYGKLLHYQWSTGDSSPSIKVNTNGNYNLKGPFSKCRSLDYTINLKMETIDKDRLKDTVVCQKIDLPLQNPYPPGFKVLVNEPTQNMVRTKDYFKRKLILQKSQCKITDTATVYVFPYDGKTIDSMYCDSTGVFSMKLNAGNAQTYNWYKNTHTARILDIFNYGFYPVSRVDWNGCRDTIVFNIINSCPFQVFIPNVFSPNSNLVNDNFSPSVSGPYKFYEMIIFNRWGEQLFQTKNSEPWNGQFLNTVVQQGVYWYCVVVYDIYNKPYRQIGSVMVLR